MKTGIFVGLVTLDVMYQTQLPLNANEKRVADAVLLAAGGPATNAAIAFQALGNRAILIGALGKHPLSSIVREDLIQHGVTFLDLTPEATQPPSFSSIVAAAATGDRAVISRNAMDRPAPPDLPPIAALTEADVVLVDGHQMALGATLAQMAQQRQIPVVVDGGSWKPGFATVLASATAAVVSETFRPPGCASVEAAVSYLQRIGMPQIVVTRGGRSLLYWEGDRQGDWAVPTVNAVDTLGAGDIFHGAFCHGIAHQLELLATLEQAAQTAALSCQFFGTRAWIPHLMP